MCSSSVCCPLCYQLSFPDIDALRTRLIKAANGPVTCPMCNETLQGLDKLTIHLFSHTTLLVTLTSAEIPPNKELSVVGSPKSEASVQSMNTHMESNETPTNDQLTMGESTEAASAPVKDICDNEAKCDICELTFRSSELLLMHNKLIHQVSDSLIGTTLTEMRYQCHLCAKVFKMKGSLRIHLKVVHLIGLQSTSDSLKLNLCHRISNKNALAAAKSTVALPQPEKSTIELRNSSDNNNTLVISNINSLDDNVPTIRHSTRIAGSPSSNRAPEAPKVWECDICSKSFTTKYFLKKHKRLHTGEMPYTCNICGKTFTFQQSYHKHLLYHSDEKPHSCQTCGRAFKELSTLHNHERIHSGEKPFKCEICGKCFRQRVSYLVHKRIHTGAMPYKCALCNKSFRYKVSQRTHKCAVLSPGTAALQEGGDLLEKVLQSTSTASPASNDEILAEFIVDQGLQRNCIQPQNNDEESLIRSIDEIVSETYSKMGFESVREADIISTFDSKTIIKATHVNRISSPSERLENLCLYSPLNSSLISPLDVICEEALKSILNESV